MSERAPTRVYIPTNPLPEGDRDVMSGVQVGIDPSRTDVTTPFWATGRSITQDVNRLLNTGAETNPEPKRPSYYVEPDLAQTQMGDHNLPPGARMNDVGQAYYPDAPNELLTKVRRPGVIPLAWTPEGPELVMPRLLDAVGNVMGGVAGVERGGQVLGAGGIRRTTGGSKNTEVPKSDPLELWHGSSATFDKFDPEKINSNRFGAGVFLSDERTASGYNKGPDGKLYNVLAHVDPSEIIDFQKPLNQQSAIIQERIKPLVDELLQHPIDNPAWMKRLGDGSIDPRSIYEMASVHLGGDRSASARLNEIGIKGAKYRDETPMSRNYGSEGYMIFDPHNLEIKNPGGKVLRSGIGDERAGAVGAAVQAQKAPPWYSAVENALEQSTTGAAGGAQWLATLRNSRGVKPEEMAWLGLDDYLAEAQLAGRKVSRAELQELVRGNQVELKDVTKHQQRENVLTSEEWEWFNSAANRRLETPAEETRYRELASRIDRSEDSKGSTDTKYQGYQLPGGENYREHLITMPQKETVLPADLARAKKNLGSSQNAIEEWKRRNPDKTEVPASLRGAVVEATREVGLLESHGRPRDVANYRSSHWDDPNILAHVRTNDRSFSTDPARYQELMRKIPVDETAPALTAAEQAELGALKPRRSLHLEEVQSDWHQAGRKWGYRTDKPIDTSKWSVRTDRQGRREVVDDNGRVIGGTQNDPRPVDADLIRQVAEREVEQGRGQAPDAPFKKTWHDLALKRMIRRAAEEGYDRLSWTPGEHHNRRYPNRPDKEQRGMEYFYDQMLPKALEKIGREHGVKVQKGGVPVGEPSELFDLVKVPSGWRAMRKKDNTAQGPIFNSGDAAEEWLRNNGHLNQPIFYIDIPPSLRDVAMRKGFPLFSRNNMFVPHSPEEREK